MMLLTDLVAKAELNPTENISSDQSIKQVCLDSRQVQKGDLFVAVSCANVQDHIKQALERGAAFIVAEPSICKSLGENQKPFVCLATNNSRLAAVQIAALFYPRQPETIVAVTGTNGKSSVVTYVRQIWEYCGFAAASLGTLGLETSLFTIDPTSFNLPRMTTPDPLPLYQTLHHIASQGITHLALEATSHGLEQYRLHATRLSAAGFLNLSQDHLDYHDSMDTYFAAKAKLFSQLLPMGHTAVINDQTPYTQKLKEIIAERKQTLLTYAINQEADISITNLHLTKEGSHFSLTIQGKTWHKIPFSPLGSFQIENILCAIGLVLATQGQAEKIIEAIPHLNSARGRMEYVGSTPEGGRVYVDYAHTPDALERALRSLKNHAEGKILVVFGCGGNRDTSKRPLMGKIAQQFADKVFITDDNPRLEDPAEIRAQILKGCPDATEIDDRRAAIAEAIANMKSQDILLIAGKGHEQGQIIGNKIIPFDDRQEALTILHHLGDRRI